MKYHIAKGVFDILPEDPDPKGLWRSSYLWQYVEAIARTLCFNYGFKEIRTPIFESTELFQRSIGQTSDIVSKEMYTFHDKAERALTLRPEGTAPVMRSLIEKSLFQKQKVHKLYYLMPMFRYERQQQGRYRQHHQFGVEAVGNLSPYQDVEVIALFFDFLQKLGLTDLTLQINSLGTSEVREKYKKELKRILLPHFDRLSVESQARYSVNCLRILDSKDPEDRILLKEIPPLMDFLDPSSKAHIDLVLQMLKDLNIPYAINPSLVRGLDYYNHTVFEVTTEALGAQNSLGGGGRYDGLIEQLGGPDLPAVGFGAGLERIIQTLLTQQEAPPPPRGEILFIPLGEKAQHYCFLQLCKLREVGIAAEMDFSDKKLKQAMNYANTSGVAYVAIVGEEELAKGSFQLKDMKSGEEEKLSFDALVKRFKK